MPEQAYFYPKHICIRGINMIVCYCYSFVLLVCADDVGQRALIGKVCMDRNNSVKHYKETIEESHEETCRCVSAMSFHT